MFRKLLDRGESGDNVGILLRGVKKILFLSCNLYLSKKSSNKLFISLTFINFWWAKRESNSHSIATIGF